MGENVRREIVVDEDDWKDLKAASIHEDIGVQELGGNVISQHVNGGTTDED